MSSTAGERLLRAYVGAVTFVGLAALAAAVAVAGRDPFDQPVLLVAFIAADAVLNVWPLALRWRNEGHDMALDEVIFVAAVFVLSPLAVLVMNAAAALLSDFRRHSPPIKTLFNFSQKVIASGVAVLMMAAVDGLPPLEADLRGFFSASVGVVGFVVTSGVQVRIAVAFASGVPYRRLSRESRGISSLVAGVGIALGLLVGAAMSVEPLLILVAVVPVAAADHLLRRYRSSQRDRDRLDGLLKTAVETSRATDVRQVEEALIEAALDLLNAPSASLDPVPAQEQSLTAKLMDQGWTRWLTVAPRREPYDAHDQLMLDGIAAVGATALQNARMMEEARSQALRDPLTGLANRTLFEDRGEQAVAHARRDGSSFALLFMDLDRFKRVNDSLGHAAGDELLRQAAGRISAVVRSIDTACRMGGDEFTVLLSGDGREEANQVAERIRATMSEPFTIGDQEVFARAHVGVAVFPDDGEDYASLLRAADETMYEAKRRERDLPAPEAPSSRSRLSMESQLHRAIERGELRIAYQPQMAVATRQIVGLEALVRWEHPALGSLSPAAFLPLAEASGLIADIDTWVLQNACSQMEMWARADFELPRVAVNLSAHLARSSELETIVLTALRNTGLDPSALELEVTERVASTAGSAIWDSLSRLRGHGVKVAVDDFGTGYSGLSRLQEFPVDNVKIDRSFIAGIRTGAEVAPIVNGAITLARAIGATVTAEGIETPEQFRYLEKQSCDIAQGYLVGRPQMASEAERFLTRRLIGQAPPVA